jgi:hypothetical protein
MHRLTIVFGNRADLAEFVGRGRLWAEDTPQHRTQVESFWAAGIAATLFQTKPLIDVIDDATLHHPDWHELTILRP